MEEENGEITLYHAGDDSRLAERFMAIVYLSEDSSTVTIKKYMLTPMTFDGSMSKSEFKKKAAETKMKYA